MTERDEFQKDAKEKIIALLKELCNQCPHQRDTHQMNCIECCPISVIIEELAGLEGAIVQKNGMTITYPKKKDLDIKDLGKVTYKRGRGKNNELTIHINIPDYCCTPTFKIKGGEEDCEHIFSEKRETDVDVFWTCEVCGAQASCEVFD